jgi:hypothetical protein
LVGWDGVPHASPITPSRSPLVTAPKGTIVCARTTVTIAVFLPRNCFIQAIVEKSLIKLESCHAELHAQTKQKTNRVHRISTWIESLHSQPIWDRGDIKILPTIGRNSFATPSKKDSTAIRSDWAPFTTAREQEMRGSKHSRELMVLLTHPN